jgi:dihydrofolate reductase
MADYWRTAEGEIARLMNQIPKLVFSRTLTTVDWNNSTLVKGDVLSQISKFKGEGNRDMYVFGSADLSETFINHGLFDEYRIAIAPTILGKGRRLFQNPLSPVKLSLVSSQQLSTGGVILKYATGV